jgi:hypothetical protein
MDRERRGKAVCLTLEEEAVEILRSQCANGRAYGKHVSDLLRAEEERRHELRQMRHQRMQEMMADEAARACG